MSAFLLKSKAEYVAVVFDGTNADEVVDVITEASECLGVVEYDTDDESLYVWDGNNWKPLVAGDVVVYNTGTERAWAYSADGVAKLFEAV